MKLHAAIAALIIGASICSAAQADPLPLVINTGNGGPGKIGDPAYIFVPKIVAAVNALQNAENLTSGTLLGARLPALSGDVTTTAGSTTTTLTHIPGGMTLSGATLTGDTIGSAILALANDGPTWSAPGTTIYDYDRYGLNGFPTASEFGSGTVSLVQDIIGAIDIPSSSTVYQANATAGYILNNSTTTAGVSVFGQYAAGANGTSGDAINGVCTNGALQTATVGFNLVSLACSESDLNIVPLADGSAPSGGIYGFWTAGTSTIQPTGDFDAFEAASPGSVQWKNGFRSRDGSSAIGISIGSLTANSGSTSSGSQPIYLSSYLSGGVRASHIIADPYGNLLLYPYAGSSVVSEGGLSVAPVASGNNQASNILTLEATNSSGTTLSSTAYEDATGNLFISANGGAGVLLLEGAQQRITGTFAAFNGASWVAASNCGSLTSSTKCFAVIDPNGNTMYVPAYGTY